MGQADRFDCSGFILSTAVDILGAGRDNLGDIRHCRQLNQLPEVEHILIGTAKNPEQYIGKLAIMRRMWTMPDRSEATVPAHIGIITGLSKADGMPMLLEAKAGVEYGAVVERPMRTMSTMMGVLAVEALCDYIRFSRSVDAAVPICPTPMTSVVS